MDGFETGEGKGGKYSFALPARNWFTNFFSNVEILYLVHRKFRIRDIELFYIFCPNFHTLYTSTFSFKGSVTITNEKKGKDG